MNTNCEVEKGSPSEACRTPRILVVDDELDVANLISFTLRAAGMEVIVARDSVDVLEQVRTRRPDLVVLDLMLPDINGISLCEMIRQFPETSKIPVIMLTAWATDKARSLGLEAGANAYMTKPFSPRALLLRVQELIADRGNLKAAGPTDKCRQLSVDLESRRVTVNGSDVSLSTDEFRMLTLLVQAVFERSVPNSKPGAST